MVHKTVEKDILPLEEVKNMFGGKVWQITKGLKDISHIYATQRIVDSENFRKLLLSFAEDIRVQLIFLAEKLYALRRADELTEKEQQELAKETNYIYIPLTHRLGLYNIKSEMEDRALRYMHPKIYREIEQKLQESKAAREAYIAEFAADIDSASDFVAKTNELIAAASDVRFDLGETMDSLRDNLTAAEYADVESALIEEYGSLEAWYESLE